MLGRGEQCGEFGDLRLTRPDFDGFHPCCVGDLRFLDKDILGQCHDDRPWPALHGDAEGAGDEFGKARGVIHLHHPLGDAAEKLLVIDLLKRLALAHVTRDLSDEQDHGR